MMFEQISSFLPRVPSFPSDAVSAPVGRPMSLVFYLILFLSSLPPHSSLVLSAVLFCSYPLLAFLNTLRLPLLFPTMSSQLISMDFDHKPNHFDAYDSSFAYMENEFFYPSNSPDLGVTIGLPQTMSPMDISSMNVPEYTLSPPFAAAPSPPSDLANISPPILSYNLSGAELSSDALQSGRLSRSSGAHSPSNFASVPRSQRYNPIAVPANRPATRAAHKRKNSRSTTQEDSEDDDDEEFKPGGSIVATDASRDSRRETVRKQRIESEQRRRDELREGYARLKETLPASNQKASKVSILDRAVSHIKYLEAVKEQLEVRLKGADHEVHRLRNVNEALMLNRAGAATLASTAFSN